MTKTGPDRSQDIRRSLSNLAASVDVARRRVDGGELIQLHDLDRAVGEICTEVARLPAHERSGLKPPVIALIDELDKLSTTLKRQHKKLTASLKAHSSHQQAAQAYIKAPSGPKRR